MFDSNITGARLIKLDLELECAFDMLTGRGIRLSSQDAYQKKADKHTKKFEKVYNGLQSPFFGADFGDDESYAEGWSCKCKKYTGKMYKGKFCENCNSFVDKLDVDLTRFGWIILDRTKVISPIYDQKLIDALGKQDSDNVLDKIIDVKYDKDGSIKYSDKDLANQDKHPYMYKGMKWLSKPENLMEVLDYYSNKKKNKAELFKELKEDIFQIFTSCIPVYSSVLRTELPGEKDKKLYKLKVNTAYSAMIRVSNSLNDIEKDEENEKMNSINLQLFSIQKEIRDIFEDTYKSLMNKSGIILGKVIGGRYNFSARNIITPSGYLQSDEIELSYSTAMELYRYELINYYKKLKKCTLAKANDDWKKATYKFSEEFYNIMQFMVTNPDCKDKMAVVISRNPCINYGSFLWMRVANITRDIKDKTMSLPTNVLALLNADFDGDVMNIFRLIGHHFSKAFAKNLNPRYNMYISRVNGRINRECVPFKDEITAFYQFNNV